MNKKYMIFPIKKQWFDMILHREKLEEYREIKQYYTTRFCNYLRINNSYDNLCNFADDNFENEIIVMFRNGYSSKDPYIITNCNLKIKTGNTNWGATDGIKYYTLCIKEIVESGNLEE